jgi:hypothetical protein
VVAERLGHLSDAGDGRQKKKIENIWVISHNMRRFEGTGIIYISPSPIGTLSLSESKKKGLSYGQTDMLCLSMTKWTVDVLSIENRKKN